MPHSGRLLAEKEKMAYDFQKHFINGEWVSSTSDAMIEVENPATHAHFARVPDGTPEDVDRAVRAARAAKPGWAATPMCERVALTKKMLALFRADEDRIVDLEVKELGQPVAFTRATQVRYQYDRTASYIALAEKSLELESKWAASTVLREPVGVVAAITPWNYPLGQIIQKLIPAVLTGNTVVLKPSQHTPLTAFLLVDAFDRAGFPKGVVNLVSGRGSRLGDAFARHPDVDMISFTGSTSVGTSLAQKALESMKRISLELGGKSPCIWLDEMPDPDLAVKKLFDSIFLNAGQTCTALSRLLVPAAKLEEAKALLLKHLPDYPAGDPTDPASKVGPLSSRAQFEKVASYLRLGLEEGATLLAGEVPPEDAGSYLVKPAIFVDVRNDMRIAQEEIFGPVLCVIPYADVDEAVRIANDTPYGLNAMVWGPKAKASEVARAVKAGNVYVNDGPRDITAPFGGYKASGLGREGGIAGLQEFTQYKAIFDCGSL